MCLHVWSDYIRLCEHRPTDQTLAEFVNVGGSELEVSDVTSSKVSKNLLSELSETKRWKMFFFIQHTSRPRRDVSVCTQRTERKYLIDFKNIILVFVRLLWSPESVERQGGWNTKENVKCEILLYFVFSQMWKNDSHVSESEHLHLTCFTDGSRSSREA